MSLPLNLHSYFKVNRGTDEKGRVGKYQIQKIPYLAITTYQQIFCLIIYIIINYHVQKVWTLTALSWLAKMLQHWFVWDFVLRFVWHLLALTYLAIRPGRQDYKSINIQVLFIMQN